MRELASFDNNTHAERAVCVLLKERIKVQARQEEGRWIIWVEHDDDRERAQALLDEFQSDPDAARYTDVVAEVRRDYAKRNPSQASVSPRREAMLRRAAGPWYVRSPVTFVLIALSVAVAAFTTDWQRLEMSQWHVPALCNMDDAPFLQNLFVAQFDRYEENGQGYIRYRPEWWAPFAGGQLWRLVTPAFIHFDVFHILFNMMWMYQLGPAIEISRGSFRFLVLVFVVAVLSNLAQFISNGPAFGGMSGVIFGMIGYAWMRGITMPGHGLGIPARSMGWVVMWLVMCMTGALGPIANVAHLGGLAIGLVIGAQEFLGRRAIRAVRTLSGKA